MDWKHYQTVDPLQKESQVGRGLFGIRVLILIIGIFRGQG